MSDIESLLFSHNHPGNDDSSDHHALIAMGGNLGNVRACLEQARDEIGALTSTRLNASSLLYRTPPIGPAGQPDYLNAVVAIETGLTPLELLDALQAIELGHGRERKEHWGARTLDLDILDIDQLMMESERLILPHPHMTERQFVLRPLCDIAPQWQHPESGKTAAQMLDQLLISGESPLAEGVAW